MVILCPMKAYPDPEGPGIKFGPCEGENADGLRMMAVWGGAALNTLLRFLKKCTCYSPIHQAGEPSQYHTKAVERKTKFLRVLKNVN